MLWLDPEAVNLTGTFLDRIFPSLEVIEGRRSDVPYETNDVLQITCVLYGKQASGKSELVRKLAEVAVERYGPDNVNVKWSEGKLDALIWEGMDNKPVQFLFCEDLTMEKIPSETVRDFFRIRHIYQKQTGRRTGLVIIILSCHRFHGIQNPALRTDIDFFLTKNYPSNPYDKTVMKGFFQEYVLASIEELEQERLKDKPLMAWTGVSMGSKSGFIYLGMAKRNYLEELEVKEADISTEVLP